VDVRSSGTATGEKRMTITQSAVVASDDAEALNLVTDVLFDLREDAKDKLIEALEESVETQVLNILTLSDTNVPELITVLAEAVENALRRAS
jgi:hypothetical protein